MVLVEAESVMDGGGIPDGLPELLTATPHQYYSVQVKCQLGEA